MATKTVTKHTDGTITERTTDAGGGGTTYVERDSGGGVGMVLMALIGIAILAFAAFFFINASRNDAIRADAVSNAASNVGEAANRAADGVASAAQNVGDAAAGAVNPR